MSRAADEADKACHTMTAQARDGPCIISALRLSIIRGQYAYRYLNEVNQREDLESCASQLNSTPVISPDVELRATLQQKEEST